MAPEPGLLANLANDLHELADSADAAQRIAAAQNRRSSRSLRDELKQLGEDESTVDVYCADGTDFVGTIQEVGLDYLVLTDAGKSRLIALFHVVTVGCGEPAWRAER